MFNSKDPVIRRLQARTRSYGKQKAFMDEFQKKDLDELLDLQDKGQKWIFKALGELADKNDAALEEKFDTFIAKAEALEDVIVLKRPQKI